MLKHLDKRVRSDLSSVNLLLASTKLLVAHYSWSKGMVQFSSHHFLHFANHVTCVNTARKTKCWNLISIVLLSHDLKIYKAEGDNPLHNHQFVLHLCRTWHDCQYGTWRHEIVASISFRIFADHPQGWRSANRG